MSGTRVLVNGLRGGIKIHSRLINPGLFVFIWACFGGYSPVFRGQSTQTPFGFSNASGDV